MNDVKVITVKWLPLFNAFTWGHTILVEESCRDDDALIAHELQHVEQIEREEKTWHWYIKYLNPFDPRARLAFEAEAYATSVRHGHDLRGCAEWLAKWFYGCGVTVDEAEAEIEKYL